MTLWKNKLFFITSASSINYGIFARWAYKYAEVIIDRKSSTGEIGAKFIPTHAEI